MKSQTLLKKLYSTQDSPQLPGRHERLLMRYMDGEGGRWVKWRAEKLISRDAQARTFLEQISVLSDLTHRIVKGERQQLQVDLWDKISTRIDQEQRAQKFLGLRENSHARVVDSSLRERLVGNHARQLPFRSTLWVGGGAFASACVIFAWSGFGNPTLQARMRASSDAIKLLEVSKAPRAVEVDWMHSDGRIRLLNDQNDRGAIIWIKPRPRASTNSYTRSSNSGSFGGAPVSRFVSNRSSTKKFDVAKFDSSRGLLSNSTESKFGFTSEEYTTPPNFQPSGPIVVLNQNAPFARPAINQR